MGVDPEKSKMDLGIIQRWLDDGADKEMIIEIVTRKMHSAVTTPRYFTKAINEAIAAKPRKKPDWERRYDKAMAVWQISGRGFEPMPKWHDYKPAEVA